MAILITLIFGRYICGWGCRIRRVDFAAGQIKMGLSETAVFLILCAAHRKVAKFIRLS